MTFLLIDAQYFFIGLYEEFVSDMTYWIIELFRYADVDLVGVTSAGNFCRRKAATSFENGISCYRGLGMTQDCARIWADTSWNTAKNCFSSCVLDPTLPIPNLSALGRLIGPKQAINLYFLHLLLFRIFPTVIWSYGTSKFFVLHLLAHSFKFKIVTSF